MNSEVDEPKDSSALPLSATSHLVIGRVLGPRGVKGELRVQVLTDFPDRFAKLKTVFVGEELRLYQVEHSRLVKGTALLKLQGIDSADEAMKLRGRSIHVPVEEAVPLSEGQYYWHQIIGLDVWTTEGVLLGKLTEILRTGANDVYVVQKDDKEVLLPAIEQVIKEIDLEKGRMVVELMLGMV
ncbi:MAG: ribosome maturation factor RimM [Chloroflexi bacterium]|nr:ribosome maturation factor RimM [Chloroflexota bacterium]MDA8187891.1 ribosome maturation factor RimM [Dehalococcoidales bacterium]